jgi:hypothetical protein
MAIVCLARGIRLSACDLTPANYLDPYGRGAVVPANYSRQAAAQPGENIAAAMKSVVTNSSAFYWEGDVPLHRAASRTIIYEMHVDDFTANTNSIALLVLVNRKTGRDTKMWSFAKSPISLQSSTVRRQLNEAIGFTKKGLPQEGG